jgi:hypothetical protein
MGCRFAFAVRQGEFGEHDAIVAAADDSAMAA